jgi:hypothetical protein
MSVLAGGGESPELILSCMDRLTSFPGIIAQDRKSAWEAGKATYDDFDKAELPELQRSSDMMWIMWEHVVPEAKRKDIEIFGSLTIGNPTTLAVIARAMKELDKELTSTVTQISMDTDQGKAILSMYHYILYARGCRSPDYESRYTKRSRFRTLPHPEEATSGTQAHHPRSSFQVPKCSCFDVFDLSSRRSCCPNAATQGRRYTQGSSTWAE